MSQMMLSRRSLLGQAALVTGLAAAGTACAGGQKKAGLGPLRRVVTGENDAGLSAELFPDSAIQTLEFNGSKVYRLWETDSVPTSLPISSDRGAAAGNAYRSGFSGSSLYVADIPAGVAASKVPMHQESSLDYMAVLSGEIYLLLETQELLMKAGDVLVQGGNLHGWDNRGAEPCRLLVVAMRAQRDA